MPDKIDKIIINELQGGFPLSERPYEEVAGRLGLEESELIFRIKRLVEEGILSRFGPMYNADRMGGAFCLCAMAVPEIDQEEVICIVNSYPETAHNYERQHELNIWFVLASDSKERIDEVIKEIETVSRYQVFPFPKQEEFFIGLRVEA